MLTVTKFNDSGKNLMVLHITALQKIQNAETGTGLLKTTQPGGHYGYLLQ
jgi:hypothetical protein